MKGISSMYEAIVVFQNLFKIVLQTSITASILVALILIIRKLVKVRLGVEFQYALWFIVILRLIVPKLPESIFSIFNLTAKLKTSALMLASNNEDNFGSIIEQGANKIITISSNDVLGDNIKSMGYRRTEFVASGLSIDCIFTFIWIVGILVISAYIIIVYKRLSSRIKSEGKSYNEEFLVLLGSCKKSMQIRKNISVVVTSEIKTPALFGHFRPIILIPKNIHEIMPKDRLRYVFLHELSHFKRKDVMMNWVINILMVIYWFNPIVLYGLINMKEDMEVCCDSLALSYTEDEEVKEYGLTIIGMMEHFSRHIPLLGTTSIVNSKSEVRRRVIMIKLFNKKSYRLSAIAIAALLIFSGVALTDARAASFINESTNKAINIDKTDYPFVEDPNIVGKWQSVDFVGSIEGFKPDSKNFNDELYVKELNFTSDGKVSKTAWTWTKDHILNNVSKTDSSYIIKDIDNSTYMFFQWKSGDYTLRGMEPKYYVLKKVSSTPSLTTNISGKEVEIREDKIDYPFVNDPEVIGKWESVDFVKYINEFQPDIKYWKGDLYLKSLNFKENGKLDNKNITWTKDLVLDVNNKTASNYIIKNIDGSKYMFFEWKNGDYIERGATPSYYVLKQTK
jgi:bla regulator protein BlaR1